MATSPLILAEIYQQRALCIVLCNCGTKMKFCNRKLKSNPKNTSQNEKPNDKNINADRERQKENPNILSKLLFCWMLPIFWRGTRRELTMDDLPLPSEKDTSEYLANELERNWFLEEESARISGKPASLRRSIIRTFFWKHIPETVLVFIHMVLLRPLQPFVMSLLLQYWKDGSGISKNEALHYTGMLVALSFLTSLVTQHAMLGLKQLGMRIRIACSSLIYRKITRLNLCSLNESASMINLLANDASKFDQAFIFAPQIWIGPIQLIVISYMMYLKAGLAALIGIAVVFVQTVPVQIYMGRLTARLRFQVATASDERIKFMTEIISGIQVIKMYAWERPFENMVNDSRKREIEKITKATYVRGMYLSFMVFSERLTLYITLLSYTLLGNTISAEMVFPLAQFLNMLQYTLSTVMPEAVAGIAEMLVSVDRINVFLNLNSENHTNIHQEDKQMMLGCNANPISNEDHYESYDNEGFEKTELTPHESQPERMNIVKISNVTAKWMPEEKQLTLDGVSLEVEQGQLCAIVGSVGAGKSSLLQLVLGELKPQCGDLNVSGTLSYASQEPWLFVATVRENILFGLPYDVHKYRKVVHVCALEKDFHQFVRGDQTLVGERGVSLSGGQRARINLARAVYAKADIYLLDDPLSAVDSIVGRQLFEECINGYLKGQTVILVTHQLQYIKAADLVIVIKDGKIQNVGSYEELTSSGEDIPKLLEDLKKEENDEMLASEDNNQLSGISHRRLFKKSLSNTSYIPGMDDEINSETLDEEHMESGMQSISLYRKYLRSSGSWLTISIFAIAMILGQVSISSCDYWVTYWTNEESKRNNLAQLENNNTTAEVQFHRIEFSSTWDQFTSMQYIYIYTGLVIACITLSVLRSVLFVRLAMNASKQLHDLMFHSLLRGVMNFFDTNPSGRVLNRFSKDIGAVDEILPRVTFQMLQVFMLTGGILVLVSVSMGWLLIPTLCIGIVFYGVLVIYLKSAQVIKRIEGVTKSPVFSRVAETLDGLPTIRCFGAKQAFINSFDKIQDTHTSAWNQYLSSVSTLAFWLETLTTIFLAVVTFSFVVIDATLVVSGNVGLAISQSMLLSRILHYGILQLAEVISQMTSVERVLQYTEIEMEKGTENKGENVPAIWPSKGALNLSKLSLKYAEDKPMVLKDINLQLQPGWKVGIVGRTGAGKTSLISALFRLAKVDGHIEIDGVDTGSVPLEVLRSKISIIPQEPVLFTASIRYNLDPFNNYEDVQLWEALESVDLKAAIPSLDYMVTQGGSNFSLGQRQLLCLARAILKNNKILVLDEATANVDPQTDSFIQQTIKDKFASCTVLTIAHRLNTIADSDRVVVMHYGQVVEFSHPHLLLSKTDSHFSGMAQETGQINQLRHIAHQKYLQSATSSNCH